MDYNALGIQSISTYKKTRQGWAAYETKKKKKKKKKNKEEDGGE
jgi:hypothetical protein